MKEGNYHFDLWNNRRVCVDSSGNGICRRVVADRRTMIIPVANDRRKQSRSIWRCGRLERIVLMSADFFSVGLSFLFAATFSAGIGNGVASGDLIAWWHVHGIERIPLFTSLIILAVAVFWLKGQYTRKLTFWDELPEIFKVVLAIGCLDAALMYFGQWEFSRMWLLLTWVSALIFVPVIRMQVKKMLINKGYWAKPTVIIGVGENAREAARAVLGEPLLGYNVKGFIVPPLSWKLGAEECVFNDNKIIVDRSNLPVFQLNNEVDDISSLLLNLGRPHVIVALDSGNLWEAARILNKFEGSYSSINIVPSLRGLPLLGTEVVHFFKHEVLLLRVQNNLARKIPQRIKRVFDVSVASMLLILLMPVFLVIYYLISKDGSKVIFKHARVGQNGKSFKCYKFQTMYENSEAILLDVLASSSHVRNEWEQTLKLKDDPRVTTIGAFLRKTSLDELPQLWNVIKGEMSLVGPRPIVEAELDKYGDNVNFYLEAKPGMTGVWQVSGRNDVSYEARVALDVWYAKNWAFWYDIVILMKTFKEVASRSGAY